jgi:hypothetical protein
MDYCFDGFNRLANSEHEELVIVLAAAVVCSTIMCMSTTALIRI